MIYLEELANLNWAIIAPFIVIQVILQIVALIDLRKVYATNGPKLLWVFVIIFGTIIGSIVYFIAGRKQS